ncbi:alpha/beta fold hydrolase [Azospirillum brasilense]|uniref:alpha/beta fold hydrolase n=1 Tax=Azospirillum brasilense TaxID=192 RepID=UPI001B3BAAFD|nr:alpha/beta fold hydrolase [Azospirillum brasilense]
MKNMLQAVILAVSVVTLPPSVSQAQPTSHSVDQAAVKNVVLVHGAFADGSGWRKVYQDLTTRGYRVTIVQNPLTSFDDDVAATRRALDRQDGPAVLVGHSWGGTVITEAGVHPKVRGLVSTPAEN